MSECTIEACNKDVVARKMCDPHYRRVLRYGSPYIIKRESNGGRKNQEYMVWASMKKRCNNKNSKDFKNYGGRGIKVCKEWSDSFTKFLADMGNRPSENYSIERVDNDGDYEPSNCEWVTKTDNVRNRRVTVKVIHKGVEMPLVEATNRAGLNYEMVRRRIKYSKWSFERALSLPKQTQKQIAEYKSMKERQV